MPSRFCYARLVLPVRPNKGLYAAARAFMAAAAFLLLKLREVREASREGRRAAEQSLIRH